MAERGKIVKGEVAFYRVRLRLIGDSGKVHDWAWRTIRGVQEVSKAKAMACAIMEDQRAPGVNLRWEPVFATATLKEVS